MAATPPLPVADAQQRIVDRIEALPAERIDLPFAHGRVTAEEITASRDLPPWDNSAMDGYAVSSERVSLPGSWEVVLDLPAGAAPNQRLPETGIARIMTGAPMPAGADAVIEVEATSSPRGRATFAERGESVSLERHPEPGANVRRRGEDVRAGDVVLDRGVVLDAARIAMAASVGASTVFVVRRPEVAIVTTGDELVDLGPAPPPDRLINSNAYGLAAKLSEIGADARVLPIVPDDADATRSAIESAIESDAVITIGGVSVGGRDFVREALDAAGVEIEFWRVAIRPGGPFAFGALGRRPVFALPGNPVSALVTFDVLARPGIFRLAGRRACFPVVWSGRLTEPVHGHREKTMYLRCRLDRDPEVDAWKVALTGRQGSGVLSSLVAADGLLVVPAGTETVAEGARVDVLPALERVAWRAEVA